jgi:acyl-coenzyme A synthetase/AMP-(fatty) acid ligase
VNLIDKLSKRWQGVHYPFLIYKESELCFDDIKKQELTDLSEVRSGDVVALIGDFDPKTIVTLLHLIDKGVILVPLTEETRSQHNYFFESAFVDVIIEGDSILRCEHQRQHGLIQKLRSEKHAGLILFSTGTTGRPKAILHDLTLFLQRFETSRPTLRTLNFLLFDHIGGLNTLLHTLFNKGTIIAPDSRAVEDILHICQKYQVEVLPTTPTFLRMMLISGLIPDKLPKSLRIITYGTERMDQPTLDELCRLLPDIDFRQTFGMSELGIVRVKSEARDSLYMQIGGEGVETKVIDGVLEIRSQTRMLGYLNADSPFDEDGWYNTKDIVNEKNGFYQVTGRTTEVINVGGLKFMASEVEHVALMFDGVELAKAVCKHNPITGQHVELELQLIDGKKLNQVELKNYFKESLPSHMTPRRIKVREKMVGHRFKRM